LIAYSRHYGLSVLVYFDLVFCKYDVASAVA
jgi:hypothetical protein